MVPHPRQRIRRSKYTIESGNNQLPTLSHNQTDNYSFDSILCAARGIQATVLPPTLSNALTSRIVGDPDEERSLHYFRYKVADNISGYFELEFWNHFVVQVSTWEPCVRHGLLALSFLHESYEVKGYLDQQSAARDRAKLLEHAALKQYTRAVGILANTLSAEPPSLHLILTSCLIFIWIEFLRDNLDTAVNHLKGGMRLLYAPQNLSSQFSVDQSVIRLLTRLHTQVTVHGNSAFDPNTSDMRLLALTTSSTGHQNLLEARYAIDNELAKIFAFHRSMENPEFRLHRIANHPYPDPLSLQVICQKHLHNIEHLFAAVQQAELTSPASGDEKQLAALAQLELQYLVVRNTLQTLFASSQMIYDMFFSDFERMISLADVLVGRMKQAFYVFSFDTGILAALLYVALKCRDLGLRRRVLALLQRAPPREGMWDRDSIIEFAEWKISKEEQGRVDSSITRPLPNNARIYAENIREKFVDGRKVTVMCYKRGALEPNTQDNIEEEATYLSTRLATLLGTSR